MALPPRVSVTFACIGLLTVVLAGSATAVAVKASSPASTSTPTLSPDVLRFVRVQSPIVVLTHVRIIDGTGETAVADRNVVVENGRITKIEAGADVVDSPGTTVLNLAGYSVMPGIVGMHNHLYYIARPDLESGRKPMSDPPLVVPEMLFSAPRLWVLDAMSPQAREAYLNTEIVFKDGVGYDSQALIRSVAGRFGEY